MEDKPWRSEELRSLEERDAKAKERTSKKQREASRLLRCGLSEETRGNCEVLRESFC